MHSKMPPTLASPSCRTSVCLLVVTVAAFVFQTSGAASIGLSRRSLFTSDTPRRHYEELIASRQIRNSPGVPHDEGRREQPKGLLRMHQAPPTQVIVAQNDRLELHCDVSGSPPPAVYWLKNGQPIREAPFEVEESTNKILESGSLLPERGLASTKSRLVIDCADEDTEAIYTCVAESRSERLVSSTYAHIEGVAPYNKTACDRKEDMHALPATIFMWSGTYIEEEGQDAVLLCRAAGSPQPKITWFDRDNRRIVTEPRRGHEIRHEILSTGDLKIKNLSWNDDMGGFTCRAENKYGSDETLTFLYPTMPES